LNVVPVECKENYGGKFEMKKLLTYMLISAVTAGTAFADPIGLKVYLEGLYFGNVIGDNYKFAGKGGEGNINPGIDFSKYFGAFRFSTSLEDTIGFSDPVSQKIQWAVTGSYGLQLADASKLSFSVYNKLHLDSNGDTFVDAGKDQIRNEISPGIRFDQTVGFGSIYAQAEFNIHIHSPEEREMDLQTGVDSGFKAGMTTNFGLWAYLRPYITFLWNGEAPEREALEKIEIRVGYNTSRILTQVTVGIPTVEDGIKNGGFLKDGRYRYGGLFIQPRITFNIVPGLSAYADFWIINIGGEGAHKPGLVPKIGVSYSF
jgi:hypothetical protein